MKGYNWKMREGMDTIEYEGKIQLNNKGKDENNWKIRNGMESHD